MNWSVEQLVEHYRSILADRMQGLPFVNDRLEVEAVGFHHFGEHQLGVLITPWFMNLVLLPGSDEWAGRLQGSVDRVAMPGGNIDFNVCTDGCADEASGVYLTAVLFRTVADFPDQETAEAIAGETLKQLLQEPRGTRPAGEPQMSRRDLFTRFGAG